MTTPAAGAETSFAPDDREDPRSRTTPAPTRGDGPDERHGIRLSVIRHAQSVSNVNRTIQGQRSCAGLTDRGHDQALHLARRLELDHLDDPITAVYSTTLARAVQTATPVARIMGLPIEYLDSWRYPDYGSVDGRTWREVYAAFDGAHPALYPHRPLAEGAEPYADFRATVEQALTALSQRHPGEHVLAFGSTENILAVNE
ncbi:histidine phosphatase family protein [Nocardia takedensis]|uniref:histidine phosphatase family protein n=1 Tax=Nocardia takedensis TaxID=259390 RepID=UPI003F75C729